ncbi:MAG: phosphohydrolase [Chitinophagia bacterium]|nr:phosphohydrolase [Chitinophagia bacterium]
MQFEEVKQFILNKLKEELPANLTYHSLEHIKDVYTAAEQLAAMEGIAGEDLTLLLTAVLFHDSGFLIQQKDHELNSCKLVENYLPGYGFTPEQIEKIRGMIMATQIPQTPHNKLEEIICDADLDYLGRDDFFTIGNKLYDELCMYGIITSENEWNKLQVRFLEKHHYFTASAKELRQAKKDMHLASIKAIVV